MEEINIAGKQNPQNGNCSDIESSINCYGKDISAFPDAFLSRMQKMLGKESFEAFLSSLGQKRLFSLRVNPLKADREKVVSLLRNNLRHMSLNSKDLRQKSPFQTEDNVRTRTEEDCCQCISDLLPVSWESDGFYYPEDLKPGRLPWHEAGMYYIQEASAMVPGLLCNAQPGERVLDLCAAPGGKSTKLAACLCGEGILVANEIHPERAKILSSNLERMGVRNAIVTNESPKNLASRFPLFFDRIVVDAPCSGEGMFRKEEAALIHWSQDNVRMCAVRQREILVEAAQMLRPGGVLVYSTCTFSPEENEGVLFRFLMEHQDFSVSPASEEYSVFGISRGRPDWINYSQLQEETMKEDVQDRVRTGEVSLETEIKNAEEKRELIEKSRAAMCAEQLSGTLRIWPHLAKGEGHFAAVLKKQNRPRIKEAGLTSYIEGDSLPLSENMEKDHMSNCRYGKAKKKERVGKRRKKDLEPDKGREQYFYLWKKFCVENLLIDEMSENSRFFREEYLSLFGDVLYGMPVPSDKLILDGMHVLRAGLQLGTFTKGRFEPSHSLGMALHRKEAVRSIVIDGNSREAYAWFRGESIPIGENYENGWTLVLIDDCASGWGKVTNGILKNHYPKGLRKGSGYVLKG